MALRRGETMALKVVQADRPEASWRRASKERQRRSNYRSGTLYGEVETPLLERTSIDPRPRLATVWYPVGPSSGGTRIYAVAHCMDEGPHIDGVDLVWELGNEVSDTLMICPRMGSKNRSRSS